ESGPPGGGGVSSRGMTDTIRMMALSGLAYEDTAPLAWQPRPALPEGLELQKINIDNAQLLLADHSLEEHRKSEPKDEVQPGHQALPRLEFKLDIIMRLRGDLLQRQNALPAPHKFRIHAQGLEWVESKSPPAVHQRGVVSLYINRSLPY